MGGYNAGGSIRCIFADAMLQYEASLYLQLSLFTYQQPLERKDGGLWQIGSSLLASSFALSLLAKFPDESNIGGENENKARSYQLASYPHATLLSKVTLKG